jgi:fibrillarin-like pre-rRNA processing protein
VVLNIKPHNDFKEIYWITFEDRSQKLGTKNLVPGNVVYGEKLVKFKGIEYRLWDPYRSKIAASILNGLKTIPIEPKQKILYLGAASGTTASHISDIIGEKGQIYCVEFSSRSLRELVNNVCIFRYNMSPILADARIPEGYSRMVTKVNCIYSDVAQPNQAKLLVDNAKMFLVDFGWVMLAIKAQSIDVTKEPRIVFKSEIAHLKSKGFTIKQVIDLEPFDKAHVMVVAQKSK